jgi:alkylation response protein AidB-like acyl-CoA dehydrogenase
MAIDFTLRPAQRELQHAARAFARAELVDVAAAIAPLGTPEERFDALLPFYASAVECGLLRSLVDGGLVEAALVAEELAAVDVNVAATLVADLLAVAPLLGAAAPEAADRVLAPLRATAGAPLAAVAFGEGDAESVARRDGSAWVLRGWQHDVANGYGWHGQGADVYVVAARLAAGGQVVVVVPGRAPGLHITGARDTAGHRAAIAPRIHFDDVRVGADDVVALPGESEKLLARASAVAAALVGAMAAGVARAAFDRALAHARASAGLEEQAVGFLLVDIKARIEAIRSLTWRACAVVQRSGGRESELAVVSKVFASETAVQAVWDAMRVVGAEACSTHLPLAQLLADAVAYPLRHGSNLGVRRRHLHELLRADGYDALASLDGDAPAPGPAAVAV